MFVVYSKCLSITASSDARKNHSEEAEKALEKVIELNPNQSNAHNDLGVIYSL